MKSQILTDLTLENIQKNEFLNKYFSKSNNNTLEWFGSYWIWSDYTSETWELDLNEKRLTRSRESWEEVRVSSYNIPSLEHLVMLFDMLEDILLDEVEMYDSE